MLGKKSYLIFIIIGVIVFLYLIFSNNGYKNDFYNTVNKDKLDNIKLKNNEYTWSVFKDAQDKSDNKVKNIIKDIVSGRDTTLDNNINHKIKKVWDNANNVEYRNEIGIGILSKYLNRVNNSNNTKELLDSIIDIENDLGVDILTSINVGSDYKDNNKMIVFFYPVTYFGNSSSDYYVNDDYMTYKAYLKRGIIQILQVYGYDKKKSKDISMEAIKFYENISKDSKLSKDLEDVSSYYNIVNNNDIKDIYSNIDIKYYLEKRGIYKYNNYSIVDKGQYKNLNNSFRNDNLDIWKKIILLKVLSSYAEFTSDKYMKVIDNINNSILGVNSGKDISDKNIDIINGLFSGDIDYLYTKNVLSDKDRKNISDMVDDIKDYYEVMLKNNKWLSKDTKDKAIVKLRKMEVYVGLKKYDNISSKYSIDSDSFLDNVIGILRVHRKRDMDRLSNGEKIDNTMSQSTVNAYYSPLENAIYIPSAIMFLDNSHDYYERLGSIGMIFAHEITHGFDVNGSKFDSDGNMADWWSKKDYKNYMKYRDKVIEYYNKYEVIGGKYINGEATVNENIADLGAISCISGIALDKKASNQDIKSMYEANAKMWASKNTKQYDEMLLLQDSHSPNKYRVNAVLSSTNLYYKVYGVNSFDKMYKSKKERVYVW